VTGRIGIFYLLGDKLLIDSSPISRAGVFSDVEFHMLTHEDWWARLTSKGVSPNTFYAEFPRGRVSYDRREGVFRFRADLCILRREHVVKKIMKRMRLPAGRTRICADGGYRCGECVSAKISAQIADLTD